MTSVTEIRYVRPEDLRCDRYQRPLDEARMKPGSPLNPFNPAAVGTFEVSERADGSLWLLDGQHRAEMARRAGHARTGFPAVVHTGLSYEEEAAMFLKLNDYKPMHPLHRFRARVIEGDKAANELSNILEKHGWRIAGGGATRSAVFAAVAALEGIYDGGRIRKEGQQTIACDRTLEILTAAFGHSPNGVKAELVTGLGLVILRYGDQIETPKMSAEMGKVQGGALGLITNAKSLKQIRGGSVPQSMAEILVEMHNKGRRTNLLPQWVRA